VTVTLAGAAAAAEAAKTAAAARRRVCMGACPVVYSKNLR
jgi:hypothetical protein